MIESLSFNNFRGFRSLKLRGLKRFNFVVGANGSGKTALLEGLFLAMSGSPQQSLTLRSLRGQAGADTVIERESYEALFRHLFHRMDARQTISLRYEDSQRGERSLTVSYPSGDANAIQVPLSGEKGPLRTGANLPIVFHWRSSTMDLESAVTVERDQIRMSVSSDIQPAAFLGPLAGLMSHEHVERFSALSKRRKTGALLAAIQEAFPQVEEISQETEFGQSSLYFGVKGVPEKLPAGLLSAGISKYLALLLAATDMAQGALLVDEIENGFYFDRYDPMMRSLLRLCREHDVQIFATTHSREFLQALDPIVQEAAQDIALIRMDHEDSVSTAQVFSGRDLQHALQQRVDVR
ncbi:MAG: AAA family ATPase [Bryobacterales bacterium]|nr:AAA family ATPase [Bryobacterales bacterium]